MIRRLSNRGEDLKAREIGLSGVVEDYRTRFVAPCERNANRLRAQARRLKDKFENAMGVNAAQVSLRTPLYQIFFFFHSLQISLCSRRLRPPTCTTRS